MIGRTPSLSICSAISNAVRPSTGWTHSGTASAIGSATWSSPERTRIGDRLPSSILGHLSVVDDVNIRRPRGVWIGAAHAAQLILDDASHGTQLVDVEVGAHEHCDVEEIRSIGRTADGVALEDPCSPGLR